MTLAIRASCMTQPLEPVKTLRGGRTELGTERGDRSDLNKTSRGGKSNGTSDPKKDTRIEQSKSVGEPPKASVEKNDKTEFKGKSTGDAEVELGKRRVESQPLPGSPRKSPTIPISVSELRARLDRIANLRKKAMDEGLALQEQKQRLQKLMTERQIAEYHVYLALALSGEQIPAPATRCHEACKKPVLTGQTIREVERGVIILSYWVRVSHAVFILTILSIIFHDYV
ncbi:uncharacterized protein LOC111244605 isoform X2 [Varroa destructor]|uniref:Uncharacterized protein n=1 Tax=Varroa destructor TaxID=109461 RepID=A0A7M7JGW7_VARDE|nr:uncharacterized protein LOC111244605 isoform X2 [Varroa destructor]